MQTKSKKNVKSAELIFTSGSLPKALLQFVIPYMLGILIQNLYGAVDLFVVGHYATTADVSAVTIGSQLMSLATQLIIGFATGVTILIAQHYGAKNEKGLRQTTGTAFILFTLLAIALTILYLVFHTHMVTAMQTPTEAIHPTREYLFACALGILFIVGYNVINSILTGLGNSRTSFLFIIAACFINIVLDIVLVKYFYMGALGTAIATTLAQAGSFIFAVLYLYRKGLGFHFSHSEIKLRKPIAKQILIIGAPVAIQNILVGFSFLFITAIINQMGIIASASVGIVEKLITFLFVPATALGTATGTASAQNFGAKNSHRAKQSLWYSIIIALIPSVLITIFCQINGSFLTGILTNNKEVIDLAANYLKSYIFDIIMVSFVFCMNGFFNSCNKSWFSLLHSLITTFAVRIPLSLFLSRLNNTSLYMIGWAAPISTLASLILCIIFLRYLHKKDSYY